MTQNQKPGFIFWIVSILALFWNFMGVFSYLTQVYMTDEVLNALPAEDQELLTNLPAWVTAAYAIAVFSGFFGSLVLLFRKKLAETLFTLSFIAVLVQQAYYFFLQDYITLSGQNIILPLVIIIISGFLMWYSKGLKLKGILK